MTKKMTVMTLAMVGALASLTLLVGCPAEEESNNAKNNVSNNANNLNNANNTNNLNNTNNKNNTNNTNNANNTNNKNNTNNVTGKASLTFKATYGGNAGNQLPASWRPLVKPDGDATLVVMLCGTEDTNCANPVAVQDIPATDRAPIQGSFGPDVVVSDLPAGTYNVMIFADHSRSIARGFGYKETPAKTDEKAWGGHVSEWDLMMSAPGDLPAMGKNPAPKAVSVTLEDGMSADLGTIVMAHFHERRIDPVPEEDTGTLAVLTDKAFRFIDLSNYSVIEAGGGFYDFPLEDKQGNPFAGSICGAIRGAGDVVYAIFNDGTVVPYDVRQRKQLFGGNVIKLPGGDACRGIYHEHEGGQYIFATAAEGASLSLKAASGVFIARIDGLADGDVTATRLDDKFDPLLKVGVNHIQAQGDTLYLEMTPPANERNAPETTRGKHNVFLASFNSEGTSINLKEGGDYEYWTVMPDLDSVQTPSGEISCVLSAEIGFAGLKIAQFKDKPVLFVGGCLKIAAYDLTNGERMDLNGGAPGKDLDASLYGQAFTSFELSPDGKTLWALPQQKSKVKFYFAKDGDDSSRQTFNRYMLLPISLTEGEVPAPDMSYATEDVDNFEGKTNIGDEITPSVDPGVDINIAHETKYQVAWSGSLAGSTNQSGSIPTGPSIAVTNKTIWLRGTGIEGNSGLGKGANLNSYSLQHRRAHLWSHDPNQSFYHLWTSGNDPKLPFGYDLTPENDQFKATRALVYVP